MNEDKDFDELELDKPLVKKIEPTIEVKVDYKPSDSIADESDKEDAKDKKAKAKSIKEELKGINEKYKTEIDAQKKEALKQEKKIAALEDEKLNNIIVIDAQNVDDRKKLMDYRNEGRVVVDRKFKPFILAEQPSDLYQYTKPPIHTIICDELIHVNVRKYYLDLSLVPAGKRVLSHVFIWAYHKGYQPISKITQEQLDYLLDEGYLTSNEVLYTFIDKSTGSAYSLGSNNGKEPTLDTMKTMSNKDVANFKLQGSVLRTGDEGFKEDKPVKEIVETEEIENETVEAPVEIHEEAIVVPNESVEDEFDNLTL